MMHAGKKRFLRETYYISSLSARVTLNECSRMINALIKCDEVLVPKFKYSVYVPLQIR